MVVSYLFKGRLQCTVRSRKTQYETYQADEMFLRCVKIGTFHQKGDLMKFSAALAVVLLIVAGQSCKDLGTPVPTPTAPPAPFNPGPQSFANDIHPILLANCATPGCHAGQNPSSGYNQSTYAGVRAGGVNYGTNVVIAGDSTNSGIMKELRGTGIVGRMPFGGPYAATGLPDTMIVKIGLWIQQGALNN